MNKKQWTGLLMIYTSYLFLGATIFYYIETAAEEVQRELQEKSYNEITRKIASKFEKEDAERLAQDLSGYCGKTIHLTKDYDEIAPAIWDYFNSFFFVVTVVSTIGYGNLHPTTTEGQVIMIFYAIVGIPLNGILLTSLGQFFGESFLRAHKKYKNHERYDSRMSLTVEILTYLVPGFILFIFLPAGVFTYFEEWDYTSSVYFAFVTLTTIGFGDLVAGQTSLDNESLATVITYKVLLICWIIFGLGYLIMLLGFVAQAMNSKKILKLEHKLMAGLTHSRAWNGFSKDIGYLRKVVNELYLDKVKPVFRDHEDDIPQIIHRSKSLPDLMTTDDEAMARRKGQRRAMSEVGPTLTLTRTFSDTDLQRIDRKATFATVSAVPTTFQLMRNVINAYSGAHIMTDYDTEDDDSGSLKGVDGFSDEEVLFSEKPNQKSKKSSNTPSLLFPPSYEDSVPHPTHRERAMSECPPPLEQIPRQTAHTATPAEWTWSGPAANKLRDVIKMKQKQRIAMNLRNGNMKESISDNPSGNMNKSMTEINKGDEISGSTTGLNNDRRGSLTASIIAGAKRLNPLRQRKRCVTDDGKFKAEDDTGQLGTHKLFLEPPEIKQPRRSLQEDRRRSDFLVNDQHYRTTTSAMAGPVSANDLLSIYSRGERVFGNNGNKELLEETSLADFLRALTNLHSQVGEHLVANEQHQKEQKPRRKMGTASMTPPGISSLLNLFPESVAHSPKPPKKRKPSKVTFPDNAATPASTCTDETPDKPQEPSNFKRLGRFILRSYSLVPKDLDEAGVTKPVNRRKRFSLWPSESEDKDSASIGQSNTDLSAMGSTQTLNVTIQVEPDVPSSVAVPDVPMQAKGLQVPQHTAILITHDVPARSPVVQRKTSHSRWQPENPLENVSEGKESP